MELNSTEKEVIGLCICLEAITDIVNHALLDVRESSKNPGEAEVYFKDLAHRSLFIIRFLDFAKEVGDSKLTGVSGSCVNILVEASKSASLNNNNSVELLRAATHELEKWLSYKAQIKLWLPALDINATVDVSRMEFLKISGNQSKHNISRLTGISREIHSLLKKNGYEVPLEAIPLALEDFQEHLEQNYFIYYGTWISELLNNLRWGIQKYLEPVFNSSIKHNSDGFSYSYEYPSGITDKITQQWFWRLMNHIRTGPYVNLFKSPYYFKDQSSLEWEE